MIADDSGEEGEGLGRGAGLAYYLACLVACVSFALLRSTVMCNRGSTSSFHQPV